MRYYDQSNISYNFEVPKNIKKLSNVQLVWQLATPQGRVMAQGQINWKMNKTNAVIPLKFDKLEKGISYKCVLSIKFNGKTIKKQAIEIYSKNIFSDINRKLKEMKAATILPENQTARLNTLGAGLPTKSLNDFGDSANKLVFCEAKKYCDNVEMLSTLMDRKMVLVMFAPADDSEIYLPQKNFQKFLLISSKKAKTTGALGVICNKEKISVRCSGGPGGLVVLKYKNGKIIIVSDSVYQALDKKPEAAIILKNNLL